MRNRILLLASLLLFSLTQQLGNTGVPDIMELYRKAEQLFNLPEPTDATDSMALLTFQQVISILEKNPTYDSLLFQSYIKKGILHDVKGSYPDSRTAYRQAIRVKQRHNNWSDSLAYIVNMYVGVAYYNMNLFDSASHFLLEAELLSSKYPGVPERDRLYNSLGALYYENGNYLLSRNYFTRGLELVKKWLHFDRYIVANFENNIAASCYRLGLYSEAIDIYRKVLEQKVFTSQLHMNMGKALSALGSYREAINSFRKVDPHEVPGMLNEMANTLLQMHQLDSVAFYLDRLIAGKQSNQLNPSRVDEGINNLYRGRLLAEKQQYQKALKSLQQAIILFSGQFRNNDITTNPTDFTGIFASFRLFDALHKKAMVLAELYQVQSNEKYLLASLATYESTIALLRYIEKSFDTDEARLFLKKNNPAVYQQAFEVCLELQHHFPRKGCMEKAFLLAEKNKASVITAGLREKTLKKMYGIDAGLLQQERNIKYNIARLNIKGDQVQDKAAVEAIAGEKARYEIELSVLQKKMEQNSSYYKWKYDESFPGIHQLQQHIQSGQALISFYVTSQNLHAFIITDNSFNYIRLDSLAAISALAQQWLAQLRTVESGRKFNGQHIAGQLYQLLVKPLQTYIRDKEEWIIIPDDILHYLPFESLPADDDNTLLLETNTISYLFSSRFILTPPAAENKTTGYSILGLAPFVNKGMPLRQPGIGFMNRLPASGKEIEGLPGKQYTDSLATRQQFLKDINQYPIVHLATHAVADTQNSTGSFIAFYPGSGIPENDCLYLDELYSINMDATELVIISACETGGGELVHSEGIISLARGFTYAGCVSTVNSLWKADDAATATILQHFHTCLQKGYTKSKALRLAKLDFINSNTLYKTPNYWAHLVLTGNTRPVIVKNKSIWSGVIVVGFPLIILLTGIIMTRYRKKNRSLPTFTTPPGAMD